MTSLFEILDGYIKNAGDMTDDRAAVESALNDVERIDAYAEFCGRIVSPDQAQQIQRIGLVWIGEVNDGNGEWSRIRADAQESLDSLDDVI